MARKKSTKPKAAPRPKPAAKTEKRITEFKWHGRSRFKCSKCSFDAGTEAEAYRHFFNVHIEPKPKPEAEQIDTGLVNESGDKIVRVEEVQNGED